MPRAIAAEGLGSDSVAGPTHASAAATDRASASGAEATASRRPVSPAARAQTARPAATSPTNACVWVTARCESTCCSATASAPRASVESAVAEISAYGRGDPASTSITSRSSPLDETTSSASSSRQAKPPASSTPLGTATSSGAGPAASAASHTARPA